MRVLVTYPGAKDRLVLRTEADWDRDVLPVRSDDTGAEFDVHFPKITMAVKPCLRDGGRLTWCTGPDYVLTAHDPDPQIYPLFHAEPHGRVSDRIPLEGESGMHWVRIYYPPGYDENTLRTFPVVYMHDGENLFFPHEAFAGDEWQVDETMDRLDGMNAIRKSIVVGISTTDRMRDYTRPGYAAYGRFVSDQLKPYVDRTLRTRPSAADTVVMGSSLGGVVSFHVAWDRPDLFGNAACLSSTFGYQDDLFERVASEPRKDVRFYLDSGWPRDNYDATNAMRDLLVSRGWCLGRDLLHFAFPEGKHHETSWAVRLHLPFQFFLGRAWSASRAAAPGPHSPSPLVGEGRGGGASG